MSNEYNIDGDQDVVRFLRKLSKYTDILDLSDQNLNSVPNLNMFKCLGTLIINHNNITSFENIPETVMYFEAVGNDCSSWKGFEKCKHLNLSYNCYLQFENLENIRSLRIDGNYIRTFENCPKNVLSLKCKYNNIESLEHLPLNLKSLNVSDNQIKSLKHCPVYLEELSIKNNFLKSLNYAPKGLKKLKIRGNNIELDIF